MMERGCWWHSCGRQLAEANLGCWRWIWCCGRWQRCQAKAAVVIWSRHTSGGKTQRGSVKSGRAENDGTQLEGNRMIRWSDMWLGHKFESNQKFSKRKKGMRGNGNQSYWGRRNRNWQRTLGNCQGVRLQLESSDGRRELAQRSFDYRIIQIINGKINWGWGRSKKGQCWGLIRGSQLNLVTIIWSKS